IENKECSKLSYWCKGFSDEQGFNDNQNFDNRQDSSNKQDSDTSDEDIQDPENPST
ncbi:900_t:CDS:2, partial [Dentiscutata erythropus]